MSTIEDLYKNFGILADAKDKAGEHEEAYLVLIGGVKGGANEKRLSSQFISRFFKYFPGLHERAIDALFDLCEDDDVNIRKQAIKDLPSLCKDAKDDLAKIADVLVQLLQTEDVSELSMVQSALVSLFKIDCKGTLGGIFSQVLSGEDLIRERALKFLALKLKSLPENTMTNDVELYFFQQTKKVLQDCTGDEFVTFMKLLSSLKHMQTMQGRQQLIEIVAEQSELDKEFQASDPDAVDRLVQCFRQALPYFSKNVTSEKFVSYMCGHVLPSLSEVDDSEGDGVQLDIVKLFAELTIHCGDLEDVDSRLTAVYDLLITYMPLAPSGEDTENQDETKEPDFKFTFVECLMFALHQLARKHTDFLSMEKNPDRMTDFRKRLQYFARGVQVYIKQLRSALQGKTGDALKTDENKVRVLALKTTTNIHTLIKDLFHNPPSYKCTVTLSWKPIATSNRSSNMTETTSPGQKRPGITPITFDSDGAPSKKTVKHTDRSMYQPPTGKFSEKAGMYSDGRGGANAGYRRGGNNRGRGGFRGRGGRGYRRW